MTSLRAIGPNFDNPDNGTAGKICGVPFTKSYASESEIAAVISALRSNRHAGNGPWTVACHNALGLLVPGSKALITHSCTAALEMAALLINIRPGDEVIMPSWTFASSANSVVLRGGIPVFVDVCESTLNIDPVKIIREITSKTRAILCVHYAGVPCDMQQLLQICADHNLILIEDAAQAVGASWQGRSLGGIGDFGAYSFHATKNISSGEGGALLINNIEYGDAAEIAWEKGTNRLQYLRGEVDSYDWLDVGSSFLPSEITAALLEASLKSVDKKTRERVLAWNYYDKNLNDLQDHGYIKIPVISDGVQHNGHIFHVRYDKADQLRKYLAHNQITVSPHYRPLHLSAGGQRFGRANSDLRVTERAAKSLLRLPLFPGITEEQQDFVIEKLRHWVLRGGKE